MFTDSKNLNWKEILKHRPKPKTKDVNIIMTFVIISFLLRIFSVYCFRFNKLSVAPFISFRLLFSLFIWFVYDFSSFLFHFIFVCFRIDFYIWHPLILRSLFVNYGCFRDDCTSARYTRSHCRRNNTHHPVQYEPCGTSYKRHRSHYYCDCCHLYSAKQRQSSQRYFITPSLLIASFFSFLSFHFIYKKKKP